MRERSRFALIVVVLLVAVAVSTAVNVQRIRMEVLSGAQLALSAAGIPFYGVDVDGRDVVLRGFVATADLGERMVAIVAGVPGVRSVHNATVVERVATRAPAAAAGMPPEVRVQRIGTRVRVSGRLPSAGAVSAWVESLREAVGAAAVESLLIEDASVGDREWIARPRALAEMVGAMESGGVLSLRGRTAVLSGPVAGATQRDRIVETARSLPDLTWRFDLFALDGTVAGGAP